MANAPQYAPPRDMYSLAPSGIAPQTQRKRVLWWHDSIIDVMLANPGWTIAKIAEFMKRKPQTLYLVTGSDVFKRRLAMRREEHSKNLSSSVIEKTTRVADKALELALNRLDSESSAQIPTLQLFSLADKALERLGYGAKPQGGVVINNVQGPQQNNYMAVPVDVLADSQRRMFEEQARRQAATSETRQTSLQAPEATHQEVGSPVPVLELVANKDEAS